MTEKKIDRAEMIETEFRKNVPEGDPEELLEIIAEVREGRLPLKNALRELLSGEAR